MLDSHGQPVLAQTASGTVGAAYTFDAKNALRGLELSGKYLKLFADQGDGDTGGTFVLKRIGQK